MKTFFIILALSILCSCKQDRKSNSSSNTSSENPNHPQTLSTSLCVKDFLNERKVDSFADIAEASFEATKRCQTNINIVAIEVKKLQGIRYE